MFPVFSTCPLTTLVYLLKSLYVNSCMAGGCMAQKLLFCPLYDFVFIYLSASFCTAHCALDFTRDHAPQKCPLLLLYPNELSKEGR